MVIQTTIDSYANCLKKENLIVPIPQQLIRSAIPTSLSGSSEGLLSWSVATMMKLRRRSLK